MAVINYTRPDDGRFKWEELGAGDTGVPLRVRRRSGTVLAVQATGTFGGSVTLQGSNDGVNWFTLKDTQGNDVSLTAAGLVDLSTAAAYVRPAAAAGVSDVDVNISLGV